ncbi:fructosamine kinase family protein [Halorussus litoreus]|uniref:fructosamine kinase family protein n=1 Tax=Halorussus litoreus TaxID=1710536 RepID=UPI000E23BDC6|nr:fructosamine kinase family protein [Halorussus litoreus]
MSDVGPTLRHAVAEALEAAPAESVELDGGEVGQVRKVALADGRSVVAKTGDTPLSVEAFMLEFLGDRGLPVPEVLHHDDDLLVMEYVEGDGDLTPAAERDAARHLAALHEESPAGTSASYGFPKDTLSGAYRQPNPWTDSWIAFYRDHRLLFVAERAREEGSLSEELFDRLESLAADLDAWLPDSPPSSLVHGDAWANNLVVRGDEVRAFLDPACYFGHAEVELAYADFVGFGDAFFETYEAERGVDAGYDQGRRDVYQLYPLLEHLRYFGDDRYDELLARRLRTLGH